MKKIVFVLTALSIAAALNACGYASADSSALSPNFATASASVDENAVPEFDIKGELVKSQSHGIKIDNYGSVFASKPEENANPLIANIFCADPTAVEYDGRLYVYGTNDQQQYEAVGSDGSNTYEKIKSIVMLSTDDMVNWTYHGIIDIEKISPWAIASWAPSVTSRVEEDGKTHFYLYYSNSGCGVGVITAENPLGPWTDPLGEPLVSTSTKGLKGCPNPFDPGVCIDENGTGWLTFGGGKAPGGSEYMPGSTRIVQLGEDMISFASEFAEIPAPYFFEASELNYINGTYVYTYNNSWDKRLQWEYKDFSRPAACSMAYMTTKTPLDTDSWKYSGDYFKNPGEQGLDYSNNHTHLQKYSDKYYLFYHALFPQKALGTEGGFRSLCVNEIIVNEETVEILKGSGTKKGVEQIKNVDPYKVNQAETFFTASDILYSDSEENGNMFIGGNSGSWTYVRGVDFSEKTSSFAARVNGKGRIEVYADSIDGEYLAAVEFDCDEFKNVYSNDIKQVEGVHDLYFVISGSGMLFDEWQFLSRK
ncbi:MAG: family 43 glycosylhydrolase [Oscillospiraceae bacterium]|nr:family 43 glycosylhydrolase [Oscillospiraceae bacterium]